MKIDKNVYFRMGNLIDFEAKVFAVSEKFFGKHNFIFKIIGKSHRVESKSLNFSEIFSCDAISDENEIIDLEKNSEKNIIYQSSGNIFKLNLKVQPILENRNFSDFDLFHDFKNGSYTGIKILKNGYLTVHTYPEYFSEILTKTLIAI